MRLHVVIDIISLSGLQSFESIAQFIAMPILLYPIGYMLCMPMSIVTYWIYVNILLYDPWKKEC